MPLYEYVCTCPCGHKRVELLRKWEDRDEPVVCECGCPMIRAFSAPHTPPDGIYSYAPNIGSADDFERKQQKIKEKDGR